MLGAHVPDKTDIHGTYRKYEAVHRRQPGACHRITSTGHGRRFCPRSKTFGGVVSRVRVAKASGSIVVFAFIIGRLHLAVPRSAIRILASVPA